MRRSKRIAGNCEQEQLDDLILITNRSRKQKFSSVTIVEQQEEPSVVRNSVHKFTTPNQPIVIDDDIEIDPEEPILFRKGNKHQQRFQEKTIGGNYVINVVRFDSITPYFGKLAPDTKKVPKARTTSDFSVPTFNLGFDSPIVRKNSSKNVAEPELVENYDGVNIGEKSVEITHEGQSQLQPNEIITEEADYQTFKTLIVDSDKVKKIYFKKKVKSGCIESSIFHDPFGLPLTTKSDIKYCGREQISERIGCVIDNWVFDLMDDEFQRGDVIYKSDKFSATVVDISELLSERAISADVCIFKINFIIIV
jgi:hypothetical protein